MAAILNTPLSARKLYVGDIAPASADTPLFAHDQAVATARPPLSSAHSSSALSDVARSHAFSDAEGALSGARRPVVDRVPKTRYAAPSPPSSATAKEPFTSGSSTASDLVSVAETVKKESIDVKTAAARSVSEFYLDFSRATQEVVGRAGSHGDQGRMRLRRDKAMIALLRVYLKWSSRPLGEVTQAFDKKQWYARMTDVVFRDVDGKTCAFVDCDKVFRSVWAKLSQEYSAVILRESSITFWDKVFGGRRDNSFKSSSSVMFPGDGGIMQALTILGTRWATEKVDHTERSSHNGQSFDTSTIKFENLPDSVKTLSSSSWTMSKDNLASLIWGLEKSGESGMTAIFPNLEFLTVSLSAAQWSNLQTTIDSATSPWRNRQSAMAATARNAMSLYDQIFDALAKILRSYHDADKKSISPN